MCDSKDTVIGTRRAERRNISTHCPLIRLRCKLATLSIPVTRPSLQRENRNSRRISFFQHVDFAAPDTTSAFLTRFRRSNREVQSLKVYTEREREGERERGRARPRHQSRIIHIQKSRLTLSTLFPGFSPPRGASPRKIRIIGTNHRVK